MNRERQREILKELLDLIRDELLAQSDKWPEEWDGFELRWLAEAAVSNSTPKKAHDLDRERAKRYKKFDQFNSTNNLY